MGVLAETSKRVWASIGNVIMAQAWCAKKSSVGSYKRHCRRSYGSRRYISVGSDAPSCAMVSNFW